MANWCETDEAAEFISTANSRETSREIMEAIASLARDLDEAEALWDGDGFGRIANPSDIWERVTGNGRRDASDYCWGAAGTDWWAAISGRGRSC